MTRYQGSPRELGVWRNTVPTRRARLGNPANSATLPYVLTRPRGILFTASRIRTAFESARSGVGGTRRLLLFFFEFEAFRLLLMSASPPIRHPLSAIRFFPRSAPCHAPSPAIGRRGRDCGGARHP